MRARSNITNLLYMKAKFSSFGELTQRYPGRQNSKAKGAGTVGWSSMTASWIPRLVHSNSQENEQVCQEGGLAAVGISDWAQSRKGSIQKVKIGSKQSRKNTEEQHVWRMGKARSCLKLKLSLYMERSILLTDFSLRLPRQLCSGQRLGRKEGE